MSILINYVQANLFKDNFALFECHQTRKRLPIKTAIVIMNGLSGQDDDIFGELWGESKNPQTNEVFSKEFI